MTRAPNQRFLDELVAALVAWFVAAAKFDSTTSAAFLAEFWAVSMTLLLAVTALLNAATAVSVPAGAFFKKFSMASANQFFEAGKCLVCQTLQGLEIRLAGGEELFGSAIHINHPKWIKCRSAIAGQDVWHCSALRFRNKRRMNASLSEGSGTDGDLVLDRLHAAHAARKALGGVLLGGVLGEA